MCQPVPRPKIKEIKKLAIYIALGQAISNTSNFGGLFRKKLYELGCIKERGEKFEFFRLPGAPSPFWGGGGKAKIIHEMKGNSILLYYARRINELSPTDNFL